MAIASRGRVGSLTWTTGGSAAMVVTVSVAPLANSLLILAVANTNFTVTSVTDTKGNTWTIAKSSVGRSVAWTTQDVGTLTITDTVTLNYAGSVSKGAIFIDEFTGASTVAPVDVSAGATFASGTARTAPSITTTNANDLIYAAYLWANTPIETSFAAGSGYTALGSPTFLTNNSNCNIEAEYQVVAATGAYAPSGTGGVTVAGYAITVSFKASTTVKTVTPTGIVSKEAFGTAHVRSPQYISGAGAILSKQAFGQGDSYGAAVYGTGFYGAGSAALVTFATIVQTIFTTAIGSAQAFGTPVLRIMGKLTTILPAGIASAEAVGRPSLFAVDRSLSSYGGASLDDAAIFTAAAADANTYMAGGDDVLVTDGTSDDGPLYTGQLTDALIEFATIGDTPGR